MHEFGRESLSSIIDNTAWHFFHDAYNRVSDSCYVLAIYQVRIYFATQVDHHLTTLQIPECVLCL